MHKSPLSTISHINPPLPRKVGDDELVSFVGMQDVSESGGLRLCDPVSFGSVKSGFTRFVENDVLFAKITPCMENGKGAIAAGLSNFIGCGSTEFHVLRANEYGSHEFIFHVTKSDEFRQKAEMNMTGSAGQRRVPSVFFKEFPVYIPEKAEQQKIAHILTTVDKLIEKTQALIDKYTAVKQGMMHDLFTRGIDLATGQLRPSYEQAPELYKETELGWVPREWGVVPLKLVVDKIADRDHFTPIYFDEGVPIISPKDFGELDKISFEKCKYISFDAHDKNRKKTDLGVNDIVFTRIGAGLGKAAIVTPEMPEFSILHSAAMIRLNKNVMEPMYLLFLLKSFVIQRQIGVEVQSIGVPDLGLEKINDFMVLCPGKNEQIKAAESIEAIDISIEGEYKQLKAYQLLKKGLMQDLLMGRVKVNG